MYNSAKSITISIFTLFVFNHRYTQAGGAHSCMSNAQTKIVVNEQAHSAQQRSPQQSPVQHLPSVTVTTVPDTSTTPEPFHLQPVNRDRDDQRENSQSQIVPVLAATHSARARRRQPNLFKRATLSHKAHDLVKEHPGHARALLTGYHDGGTMRIKNLTKNTDSVDLRYLIQKVEETPQASQWIAESEAAQAKIQAAMALQEAENKRAAQAIETHRARGGSDADQPRPSVVDVNLDAKETNADVEEAEQKAIADSREQQSPASQASQRGRMGRRERYIVTTP